MPHLVKGKKQYRARAKHDQVENHLGYYDTYGEAAEAEERFRQHVKELREDSYYTLCEAMDEDGKFCQLVAEHESVQKIPWHKFPGTGSKPKIRMDTGEPVVCNNTLDNRKKG